MEEVSQQEPTQVFRTWEFPFTDDVEILLADHTAELSLSDSTHAEEEYLELCC